MSAIAKVKFTVEVPLTQPWSESDSMKNIRKAARTQAMENLRGLITPRKGPNERF